MDLKLLAAKENHFDDPIEVVFYDENGDPQTDSQGNATSVFVVGEFSKSVKRAERINALTITRLTRTYGKIENIPQVEWDKMNALRTAAAVPKWTGMESGTEPFAYSAENALALVTALQQYEPEQYKRINAAIAAHASFFTKPSAS